MLVQSTDAAPSIDIEVYDDSGLPVTGLLAATMPTVYYSVAGANAKTSITLSDLAAETTAWSAGGLKERGNGVYRLDLPTATINVAGRRTRIFGYATGKNIVAPVIDCGPIKTDAYGLLVVQEGTLVSATASTAVLAAGLGGNNFPSGYVLKIISGTGAGQSKTISTWTESTRTAIFASNWITTPDNTSVYQVIGLLNAAYGSTALPLVSLQAVRGINLTETVNGRFAAAMSKFFDVATPVHTCASVDQTGDTYKSFILSAGTATAGAVGAITLQNALGTDALAVGASIAIVAGTGAPQTRQVFAYTNATKVVTVDRQWAVTPDATSQYVIYGIQVPRIVSGSTLATGADLRSLVGTTLTETIVGNITAAFKKFFDVATPTHTCASIDQTGDNYKLSVPIAGTLSSGGTSSVVIPVSPGSDGCINGATFIITGGAGFPQSPRQVQMYTSATRTVTFDRPFVTPLDATTTFAIVHATSPRFYSNTSLITSADLRQANGIAVTTSSLGVPDVALTTLSVNAVRDAVWNAVLSTYTTVGTVGKAITDYIAQLTGIKAKTDLIPLNPAAVGSQMDLVDSPNVTARTAMATTFWGMDFNVVINLPSSIGNWIMGGINQLWGGVQTIEERTNRLPDSPASTTNIVEVRSVASQVNVDSQGIAGAVWSAEGRTLTGDINVDISGIPPLSIVVPRALVAVSQEASLITVIRGDTLRVSLPLVGNLISRLKLTFTVKASINDSDRQSVVQIVEETGLTRLNGNDATSPMTASLTVRDEVTGQVDLELDASVTAQMTASDFVWDMQVHSANVIQTPLTGTMNVVADVTRAVT